METKRTNGNEVNIVSWMSGLNQQFAKLQGAERCPEGSNPSLTANNKGRSEFESQSFRHIFKGEKNENKRRFRSSLRQYG